VKKAGLYGGGKVSKQLFLNKPGDKSMPIIKEPTRTRRTKCYIHEMQRPLELPYKRLQYHICWICESRLLELAKAGFQFKLRDRVVTVSAAPEVQEKADPGKGYKAKRTQQV
jgi:hypothetical protein